MPVVCAAGNIDIRGLFSQKMVRVPSHNLFSTKQTIGKTKRLNGQHQLMTMTDNTLVLWATTQNMSTLYSSEEERTYILHMYVAITHM